MLKIAGFSYKKISALKSRTFVLANRKGMTKIVAETAQDKTFFELIKGNTELDLRDSRGKQLNLPLVLIGVIVALLRGKDGNLSSIHRSIKNTHSELLISLNIDYENYVSRSHLPILLKKVNGEVFSEMIFKKIGIELSPKIKEWFGIDGKELRGSILCGNKRGEAVVPIVRHSDKSVLKQGYYNGNKESERPEVCSLLESSGVATQSVSLDALHFVPKTLETIASSSGIYLVGLKNNQAEMFDEMGRCVSKVLKPDYQYISEEKGHGRTEKRHYKCWNIKGQYMDKRWGKSNLTTLIEVTRERTRDKTGEFSREISLYMSNQKVAKQASANELFQAIRGHWSSEVYNNIRDTTLAEDKLKTIYKEVSINLSIFRTLVISILNEIKPKNMAALIDDFADNFSLLIHNLRQINFL